MIIIHRYKNRKEDYILDGEYKYMNTPATRFESITRLIVGNKLVRYYKPGIIITKYTYRLEK